MFYKSLSMKHIAKLVTGKPKSQIIFGFQLATLISCSFHMNKQNHCNEIKKHPSLKRKLKPQ